MMKKSGCQVITIKEIKKPSGKIIKKGTIIGVTRDKMREMVAEGVAEEYESQIAKVSINKMTGKATLHKPITKGKTTKKKD